MLQVLLDVKIKNYGQSNYINMLNVHIINIKTEKVVSFQMSYEEYKFVISAEEYMPHIQGQEEYYVRQFHDEKSQKIRYPAAILIKLYKDRNPNVKGNNTYYIAYEHIDEDTFDTQYSSANISWEKSIPYTKKIATLFKLSPNQENQN